MRNPKCSLASDLPSVNPKVAPDLINTSAWNLKETV